MNDISISVTDMKCELNNSTSEEDFVRDVSNRNNIDTEFARLFAMNTETEFVHSSITMKTSLSYWVIALGTNDHTVYSKGFIDLLAHILQTSNPLQNIY